MVLYDEVIEVSLKQITISLIQKFLNILSLLWQLREPQIDVKGATSENIELFLIDFGNFAGCYVNLLFFLLDRFFQFL